jgi:hypothetical protein
MKPRMGFFVVRRTLKAAALRRRRMGYTPIFLVLEQLVMKSY